MDVNWAAFAVAVVAQMIFGYIWFHPGVMGKKYAKALGVDIQTMKPKNPGVTYGLTFLLTIFFTLFLMTNVTGPGQQVAPDGHSYVTIQHGLVHAVIFTLMVLVPVFAAPAMFEKRGWAWYMVHIGYWALRAVIAFSILSAWR